MDLNSLSIPKKHLQSVLKNLDYNRLIGSFYERMIADSHKNEINRLENKLERLQNCNNLWELDVYKQSLVKDFIRTNLCRDKFCNNCKKVKQASRMAKFMPEITRVGQKYNLSQMVLTVPNIIDAGDGVELRRTIKTIFKAFASLIDYLKLYRKIKGVSFDDFGYVGAIRSLEVTYKNNEYHPHLHVLIAHSSSLGEKNNINKYSYDKFGKRAVRSFSDFEVLIQKLWFLLINDIKDFENSSEDKKRRAKITKSRLDQIEDGYSCMVDEFQEDDFLELFKYMTKGNGSDHKEENSTSSIMNYNNFKVLYFALNSVRQIQGYGEFFRIKDDEELFEGVEETYEAIINQLKKKEEPEQVSESVQALLNDTDYTVISKKQIYKFIKKIDK